MLSILIMDDEPYVREGLKRIIPWEEIGFKICGEAVDGDDGYKKIVDLKPDLILIDIKMPGKSGIDVIREAKDQGIEGKFVIISGYSDFKYAKSAIKYGVKDYLLKPIDEDELLEIAINLKKEIDSERAKNKSLEINNKVVREYTLEQLMLGKVIENYMEVNKYFRNMKFQVALISNNYNQGKCDNLFKLESIVYKSLENIENIDIVKIGEKISIILNDVNIKHTMNILNRLKREIDSLVGGTTFIVLGEEVDNINRLAESYNNAKNLMNNEFLFLEFGVVSNLEIKKRVKNVLYGEDELFSKAYNYVEIGEVDKVKEILIEIGNVLRSKMYSEEKVKAIIIKNFIEFKNKIRADYNLNKEDIESNENIIDEIYKNISLENIIDFLVERFINISGKICAGTSDNSVKRIVKYIEKNYSRELKLELLAEIFNYNSAYLGKVFKNYTGQSFNVYLDKIRIEQAKKLLMKENLKVYQVCEKVGYKNIDYFHSKFKKYVGVSPLNYKKQIESIDEKSKVEA